MTHMTLKDLEPGANFISRHIGPDDVETKQMLREFGAANLEDFIQKVVPEKIRAKRMLDLKPAMAERTALSYLRKAAERNDVYTSMIGMGYYGTVTPKVILRNILENPGWYTAYTPYQAEVSQGRLEALLNYQQMIMDMTGLDIANASLLDEGTAAAEAMGMARRVSKSKSNTFFVDQDTHPQTISVIETRAKGFGIEVRIGDPLKELQAADVFAALLSYPGSSGEVRDFSHRHRRAEIRRCPLDHGHGFAGAGRAQIPRRTGCRCGHRLGPALRRAHGLRRPACGLLRHEGRAQARHARPPDRRVCRCTRQPCAPHGAADARTAHPPRKGHQQHLHGAGAARHHRLHVRRLQWPQGHSENRRTHPAFHADFREGRERPGLHRADQGISSTR